MSSNRSYEDKTSAAKNEVGFDYQYFYFIYRLLQLKPKEIIGYEVKDDIHLELPNGTLILIQAKHSLKKKADQTTTTNLTERDVDLWKTLYTWSMMISDKTLGRSTQPKKLEFINKTQFVLVTNKNESKLNNFLDNLDEFQEDKIKIKNIRQIIQALADSTKADGESPVIKYMQTLLKQNDALLGAFLKKIEIKYDQDQLLELIRSDIKSRLFEINEFRLDMAFDCIISNLVCWKYDQVKKNEKILISYDDVVKKLSKCFLNARREDKLPRRKFNDVLPDNFEDQIFIKQLVDMGEVKSDDTDKMAELTTYKININKHLDLWVQEGEISEDERESFHNESALYWDTCFQEAHLTIEEVLASSSPEEKEKAMKLNARMCLIAVKKTKLTIDTDVLELTLSNGEFYWLSDQPRIGWRFDWKEKYKL